jgi:tRNA pseudouridine13 synthase
MKLKQRIGDFRVRELLRPDFLCERGDFTVYRVTKRKLTSTEAAGALAAEAGVNAADVGLAGLKDRQGITIQFMTVSGGKPVRLRTQELLIEPVGRSTEAVSSAASLGNAFEIVARDLDRWALQALRRNVPLVREHGVVNYFDEQRFGNLKHGQGWIARDLMLGSVEKALRTLLTARSVQDNERRKRFKQMVASHWGDWRECRDEAGRFGQFHSVFEHLAKAPTDFAGAFQRIALRLRLIHLYAYQSHVWNRAVSELTRRSVPLEQRIVLESFEGGLVTFAGAQPAALAAHASFPLPGDGLDNVQAPLEREILTAVLAEEPLTPEQFAIHGVPGFQLKGEERPLVVIPQHLRVRPPEEDPLHPRAKLVRVRFDLPRGSYATLILKRLLARPGDPEAGPERAPARAEQRPRRGPAHGRAERGRDDRGRRGR